MNTALSPLRRDLADVLGKHIIYTYANGWKYEMFVKTDHSIDYRIHGGIVAGRWVRDQTVNLANITFGVFRVSWDEPTGTSVAVTINVTERLVHGVIFFPGLDH